MLDLPARALAAPPLLPSLAEVDRAVEIWRAAHPPFDAHLRRGLAPLQALRHFGISAWSGGEPAAAAAVLKAALALAPGNADLWADLAGALQAAGETGTAHAALVWSLTLDKGHARRWLTLAGLSRDLGNSLAAEEAFLNALDRDAALHDAWFGLGLLHLEQRRLDDAVAAFQRAIAAGSAATALYACLGEALYLQGRLTAAALAFARQVAITPDVPKIVQKSAFLHFLDTVVKDSLDKAWTAYADLARGHAEPFGTVCNRAFHVLSGYGFRDAALCCGRATAGTAEPVHDYLLMAVEGAPVSRAPDDYIVRYFDHFAAGFDQKLVDVLDYRVPEKLWGLVAGHSSGFAAVLDAGCGTGLAGPYLRAPGRCLTGVDLSPRMLEKAAERQVYGRLVTAEIGAFLSTCDTTFDLIFAADVLIYFGDLAPILRQAAHRLAPGALFAFSLEVTEEADMRLLPSGRFAHRPSAVTALSEPYFTLEAAVATDLRLEATRPVAGMMFVMRRRT